MQTYFDAIQTPHFSAAFDYFRIPRHKWPLMLGRLAQLGVNFVSLTIPWGFHEFEKGTIDLTGATNARRDLAGFIDLCAALNFYCLLKLGPVHPHRGILNDGLPHWIAGRDTSEAALSWFQALSKALVKQQWPDGPVAALHIDDRLAQQQPQYSEELTEVRWPIWLRKRYKGMDALNEAYGSTYRSVSDVPFPQSWSQEPTALENDARQFLAEGQEEVQNKTQQTLTEAGWQIPIYPFDVETQQLPALQEKIDVDSAPSGHILIDLQNLIQVDPDPGDVGRGSVWADEAPIRAGGSVRRTFWQVRQVIWANTLDQLYADRNLLTMAFENGGLATTGQDMPLKLDVPKGIKPVTYRLYLNGEIRIAGDLNVKRGKLTGSYLSEDVVGQIDLIFYLADPSAPVNDFLGQYLRNLLRNHIYTMTHCARLAANLSQSLQPKQSKEKAAPAQSVSYTIAEARRGLSEADQILRKAIASIGGLEAGFEVMFGRSGRAAPTPADTPPAITPEIFEGRARDVLLETGRVCAEIAPALTSVAQTTQQAIDTTDGLTIAQYRQLYTEASTAARQAYQQLSDIMAGLRVEMASETLPLVVWRVHNQVLEIAETLRGLFLQ